MPALAQTTERDYYTRAANDDCIYGGPRTRTKYAYDAAGNATGFAGAVFGYDNRGRMTSASYGGVTASYVYNALGQRVKRTLSSGTTLYVYDESGHLLGEYDGSGALVQETVWLGDIPVATLRPNGASVDVYYVHTDHLDTPRLITQPADNAVRWRWDSDPFGTDLPNEDPSGRGTFTYNLRFPGQLYDGVVGLHYNYFRDYDASTGRYIESDPIGLRGGMNLYNYANGNPVTSFDPTGENPLGVVVPAVAVGTGLYCYRRGLKTCELLYPRHRDREHPDFANFIECSSRMTIWAALIIGMSSDPVGMATSTIGEEIGRRACDSCERN